MRTSRELLFGGNRIDLARRGRWPRSWHGRSTCWSHSQISVLPLSTREPKGCGGCISLASITTSTIEFAGARSKCSLFGTRVVARDPRCSRREQIRPARRRRLVASAVLACACVSACGAEPERSRTAGSAAVDESAVVTAAPERPVAVVAPQPGEMRVAAEGADAGGGTDPVVPPEAVFQPAPDWSRFPGGHIPRHEGVYSMKIDVSGKVTDVRVERRGPSEGGRDHRGCARAVALQAGDARRQARRRVLHGLLSDPPPLVCAHP